MFVVKSNGSREPFDRNKIVAGVSAAAKGRPVASELVELVATTIEDQARLRGGDVSSAEIGLEVLDQLHGVDDVAYLRFASVYKGFDDAADFRRELVLLEKLSASGREGSG